MVNQHIGQRIQDLRKDYKITQVKFAEKIGISVRTLHRWETGDRLPTIDILKNIFDIFEITDIYEFMYGKKVKNNIQLHQLMWI
jgi:transcriptional regulator with XRE-family HTH domain